MNLYGIPDAYLSRQSRNVVLLLTLGSSLLIGALDYYTRADLLILYIIPVYVAAWYGGSSVGGVIAIYCAGAALVSLMDKVKWSVSSDSVWGFVARLLIYLLIVRIISSLRKTMQQREELTRFIVHDLRSPIGSAITGLQTLELTKDSISEENQEMLQLALVSNQRALSLVNAILDIAKLEDGKMSVNKAEHATDEFAEKCFVEVSLWAKTNEITLETEITRHKSIFDAELTSRVVVNLLSNALKISPPGTKIILKIAPSGSKMTEFSIIDQGPGIPADYAESIFDPFVQVKGTRGGTGLGLTFCRLAVQAQGGKIWVESELGKGTAMKFQLPG